MCVICTALPGTMPDSLQLAQMSAANPDGAGIAWHDGKGLHRYRNPDNDRTLGFIIHNRDILRQLPVLIHFRLATNGPISTSNTHPFKWNRDGRTGYMAHNGVSSTYSHGPHQCGSRNAIAAWEQGADLSDGREGAFASIDQDGRIEWLTPGEDIDGAPGTITVSNTYWQTGIYGLDPDTLWEEAYQLAHEELRKEQARPDNQ